MDRAARRPAAAKSGCCCAHFQGRAVNPGRFHADAAPELVQPPEIGGKPGEATSSITIFRPGYLANTPSDDQAGQLRLERLRLRDIILDVIGAQPTEVGGLW